MISVEIDNSSIGCRVMVMRPGPFRGREGQCQACTYKVTARPDGASVNERSASYGVKLDIGPFVWFRPGELQLMRKEPTRK